MYEANVLFFFNSVRKMKMGREMKKEGGGDSGR
jgi:hypothetical protein